EEIQMRCSSFRPDIALYVEGDLAPSQLRVVEAHLAHCADCRTLADELQRSQNELRGLRNEIIDAASLARVRSSVLDQVRQIEERRTWLDRAGMWLWGNVRLRYAILGSLTLLVVGTTLWHTTQQSGPKLVGTSVEGALKSTADTASRASVGLEVFPQTRS